MVEQSKERYVIIIELVCSVNDLFYNRYERKKKLVKCMMMHCPQD